MLEDRRRVHMIGVGGSGMSALAKVLIESGFDVTGSDLQASRAVESLRELGATVFLGHRAENVGNAELVIVSSAVRADNPELMVAQERGIPVVKRAEALGELTRRQHCIAVAGTHGKTTTTSMIALTLVRAGLDPTFVVGGEVADLGTSAKLGRGKHIVVEADEFDGSFLRLSPKVIVLTNIEADHLDFYGSLDAIERAFAAFVALVPRDGLVLVCADDPLALKVARTSTAPVLSYGLAQHADWLAADVQPNSFGGNSYRLYQGDRDRGLVQLRVPGLHNATNSVAALAVAFHLGVSLSSAREALASFSGARRRFEVKGTKSGVTVVDDYAHHPTEVRATLQAARERYPGRLWCVFQPHTYHRTKSLLGDFASSFSLADRVLVVDIYVPAGREVEDLGISADDLVQAMSHPGGLYIGSLDEAVSALLTELRPGDVVLTLGAGDVYQVGDRLLESLGR